MRGGIYDKHPWVRVAVTDKSDNGPDDGVFSYRAHKDGAVRIAWRGRVVTTLAGKEAARFLLRIEGADGEQTHLLMAKATGNFKRGNEWRPGRP